jgi:hypothetical protein
VNTGLKPGANESHTGIGTPDYPAACRKNTRLPTEVGVPGGKFQDAVSIETAPKLSAQFEF